MNDFLMQMSAVFNAKPFVQRLYSQLTVTCCSYACRAYDWHVLLVLKSHKLSLKKTDSSTFMQYLIYDPDYSSLVPYRWSNNTDLRLIEFFSIYNISFFTRSRDIYFAWHFPHTGKNQDSLFDTFTGNGRLYITCLQKQIAKKNVKSRLCSINLIKIQ